MLGTVWSAKLWPLRRSGVCGWWINSGFKDWGVFLGKRSFQRLSDSDTVFLWP